MLYHRIRLGLILLFLAIGLFFQFKIGWSPAWYLYLGSLILVMTHYLFGTVWAAFGELKKGNIMKAELLLLQTKRPSWLAKRHRAYYYFIKGMVSLQKKELKQGVVDLQKGLEIGLRNNKDKAMASLNLAHAYYLQKQFDQARSYLIQTKSYQAKDLLIQENIQKLEQVLAQL